MGRLGSILGRWRLPLTAAVAVIVGLAVAGGFYHWRTETVRLEDLKRRGEEALDARNYAEAREHLLAYLEARPKDTRARLLAARSARRLKLYDEAAEDLRRCREDGGDEEAIETEHALVAVQSGNPTPVPMLRARVAEKDDELALVILEVLIQYDLDNYRLRDALQGFNLYLQRRPDDLHALIGRGSVWERFLSFAGAVTDYRRAVEVHPTSVEAHRRLAGALLVAGTPAEAVEQYRWLAANAPDDPTVKLGLAKCYRQLGSPEQALPLLTAVLASAPDQPEALWERGELEMDRNYPAGAEPWLRRAASNAPFDRRIVFSFARCLRALGHTDEAGAADKRVAEIGADLKRLDEIRTRVMSTPDDVALRCEGAAIFLKHGEKQEGVRWLRLALRADPNCAAAQNALARVKDPSAP
jgi:tetratricopeptide (TPR) repeat protein